MRRTSFFLDEALLEELRALAAARGVGMASVVREALVRYVAQPDRRAGLPSVAGRFRSGTHDTAERADDCLWHDPHA